MQIYPLPATQHPIPPVDRAVALGYFDGVHIGHRAVICRTVTMGARGLTPAVFTFDRLPTKSAGGELLTGEEKHRLIAAMGVQELFSADFQTLRNLSPAEFVKTILQDTLHAKVVCCGEDFTFGKNGEGNLTLLQKLCAGAGIEVAVVPPVQVEGGVVSSSRIRRLIRAGEMMAANRLLGRCCVIDTPVLPGQQLGRTLGFPTINQALPEGLKQMKLGVYASAVMVDGQTRYGVTNIGIRPTVNTLAEPLAETWIPDYAGDLYGQPVPVMPLVYLRPEIRFESLEQLKQQLAEDKQRAREALQPAHHQIKAILFDFDDTLQDRAVAFAGFCRYFMEKYFPRLSPEQQAERTRQMTRLNNRGYVRYEQYFEQLIELWQWEDHPPVEDLKREFQVRFPDTTTLFEDAVAVLTELRRRGYRVGVVTNGPAMQQNRKLDVSGLRPLLDVAVVSGDEDVHKPDPELFRRAAIRLGLRPQHCVYVGDHLVNDIQGAIAAGCRPVLLDAIGLGQEVEPGIPVIHRLSDLLKEEWL